MQFNFEDLPSLPEVGFTKDALFVDFETTGLPRDLPNVAVISIGAVLMSKDDGSVVDEFYTEMRLSDHLIECASDIALGVNGFTRNQLRNLDTLPEEGWDDFDTWCKSHKLKATKLHFVAHNVGFELAFLAHHAPQTVKRYGLVAGHPRIRDTIKLYNVAQSKHIVPYLGPRNKGKKGENIAQHIGVEPEPAIHNALEGARQCYRIYTRLAQLDRRWRNENGFE